MLIVYVLQPQLLELVASFRDHVIFSFLNTVVLEFKKKTATDSPNVLSEDFETLPENCRQRYAKKIQSMKRPYSIGHSVDGFRIPRL